MIKKNFILVMVIIVKGFGVISLIMFIMMVERVRVVIK